MDINELLKMVIPRDWLLSNMPKAASAHANDLDALYWFLIISCTVLFLLLIVPLIFILFYYRRKHPGQRALSQTAHNFWLESLWTFLPFIYLGVLFVWGFQQYLGMYVAPNDSKELRIVGQKWQWSIDYPKDEVSVTGPGVTFAVPVNKPIKLIMSSQDVIHSFFIPSFRVKQDVVPGKYSTLWFKADQTGEYPVLCAEYCGDLHSQMLAKLVVMEEKEYEQWLSESKSEDEGGSLEELGKKLYTKLGCVACHTTDGSIKIAPSFKGIYGKMEEFADGTKAKIDDEYIRNKILQPTKHVAKGYPPVMPSFQGRVKERDISGLIEFIKSLSTN